MKIESLKNKKVFLFFGMLVFILTIFSVIRLVAALNAVRLSSIVEARKPWKADEKILGWEEEETRNLQKEIYWVEEQLKLSKSDSISLGINLVDNVILVQLKGTTLYRADILKQTPAGFFDFLDEGSYSDVAKANIIENEISNIPKKPMKKVQAPKSESEVQPVSPGLTVDPSVYWSFNADNYYRIVILGVQMDADSLFVVHNKRDLLHIRFQDFYQNEFSKNYSPVLFLWLKDTEAKTIYRAVPPEGKVIFRN